VLAKAQASFDAGDYRWAATVLDHLVFAEPGNAAARELLARCYDQLGYRAESGPWRDVYLSGAFELRHGEPRATRSAARRSCCATRRCRASSTRWRRASTARRPTA
jgi:alkyl sulfatase BDS1-like metallo-beta-lactamase superfamily hydrolase